MKTRITELFDIERPIIQGGMGAAVSSWRLAKAVSRRGQLGVVSGVALDLILARRLQDGKIEIKASGGSSAPFAATKFMAVRFGNVLLKAGGETQIIMTVPQE